MKFLKGTKTIFIVKILTCLFALQFDLNKLEVISFNIYSLDVTIPPTSYASFFVFTIFF